MKSTTDWYCGLFRRQVVISCQGPRTAWATSACGSRSVDTQAGPVVQAAKPKADFSPGSDDKRAWLSLSVSSDILSKAAGSSANVPLTRIAGAVGELVADSRYVALDSRRGMDYHRLRPQSVPHASPKGGISRSGKGIVTIELPGPVLDPEADEDRVCRMPHRCYGGGAAGHEGHPRRPRSGDAGRRSLVSRTTAPTDCFAKQQAEQLINASANPPCPVSARMPSESSRSRISAAGGRGSSTAIGSRLLAFVKAPPGIAEPGAELPDRASSIRCGSAGRMGQRLARSAKSARASPPCRRLLAATSAVRKPSRINVCFSGRIGAMARRRGGREPNPYERWARERLEPILGTLREIDPGGGPRPLHDFEADLPGGGIAAIEVTGQVEAKRLEQASSAQRRFDSFTLPGSSFVWQVGLDPRARVNAIRPRLAPRAT